MSQTILEQMRGHPAHSVFVATIMREQLPDMIGESSDLDRRTKQGTYQVMADLFYEKTGIKATYGDMANFCTGLWNDDDLALIKSKVSALLALNTHTECNAHHTARPHTVYRRSHGTLPTNQATEPSRRIPAPRPLRAHLSTHLSTCVTTHTFTHHQATQAQTRSTYVCTRTPILPVLPDLPVPFFPFGSLPGTSFLFT